MRKLLQFLAVGDVRFERLLGLLLLLYVFEEYVVGNNVSASLIFLPHRRRAVAKYEYRPRPPLVVVVPVPAPADEELSACCGGVGESRCLFDDGLGDALRCRR
jgi:hypothetical protein